MPFTQCVFVCVFYGRITISLGWGGGAESALVDNVKHADSWH